MKTLEASWLGRILGHVFDYLRWLITATLVRLFGIALLIHLGQIAFDLLRPAFSATTQMPNSSAIVTAEFRQAKQFLTVQLGGRSVQWEMGEIWDDALRVSLYDVDGKAIAVLVPFLGDHFITLDPLAEVRGVDTDSANWVYLGAFDFHDVDGRRLYQFIKVDEEAECIPVMMDWRPEEEASWSRKGHYKRSC